MDTRWCSKPALEVCIIRRQLNLTKAYTGGGRGIRVIREGDSIQHVMETASSEAAAAFGDGSLFLEK